MTKKRQLKARPRRLSHLGTDGEPRMVDVSLKPATPREAVARATGTVVALAGYLRHGVPAVWEKAEGTR